MFVDWKLVLRQHPQTVMERVLSPNGVYGPAGWVAFRHPCTTSYSTLPMCRTNPTDPWILTEVRWPLSARISGSRCNCLAGPNHHRRTDPSPPDLARVRLIGAYAPLTTGANLNVARQ
jgi:hypothetical protein